MNRCDIEYYCTGPDGCNYQCKDTDNPDVDYSCVHENSDFCSYKLAKVNSIMQELESLTGKIPRLTDNTNSDSARCHELTERCNLIDKALALACDDMEQHDHDYRAELYLFYINKAKGENNE